ncbi:BRCA1-A complex subunit Abraxas 1-like [Palaemon carinicauda]|uniref:BRCA1-A complex subunit Abraxas 1-like n=1 Tax=Palaemon carinicauda TaxID=392227 RepID=UPI0035B62455
MNVRVSCSGAVLSSLLYEQLRTEHAQEGFLLGSVENHISEHISDSQICNEKMETTICISSFQPCTMIGSFYSGAGELNNEKLSGFLGKSFQHVIGWYRCRGTSCEDLYMREIMVHKQLSQVMTHTGGHFILGILSCNPSDDSGTFTVCHKFMMQQNDQFEGLPLQVINMGDTSTDEYRLKPRNPALYSSSAVNLVLSNLKNSEPGIIEAENLHSGLLQKLDTLLPKFSDTQKELEKILQEVTTLRMLCCNDGIPLDFTPENVNLSDDSNLMDFEEFSSSHLQNKRGKSSPVKGSVRRKNIGRGRATKEEKVSSDPFGFVNKEMEKLQVRGRGSPTKRSNRSRTNTPSPGRILTGARSGAEGVSQRRSSESAGSNESSPVTLNKRSKSSSGASSQRNSQDDFLEGRPKTARTLARTASKDSQSKLTRSQSPAVANAKGNKPNKLKKKEAWGSKSDSGSQDF